MLPAQSLKPQVAGRLAGIEAAILKVLSDGEDTWRTTISLEATLALAAVRAADAEKRDFSNFVAVVLAEYSQSHGALAGPIAEALEKTAAALRDDVTMVEQLNQFLATSCRQRRRSRGGKGE